MSTKYEREIVRLHRFFVEWFTGQLPKSKEAFAAFADCMATGFAIVGPNGRLTELEELEKGLYDIHGRYDDFDIKIKNVVLRRAFGNWAIVTYEEWQVVDGEQTARLSSVLMEEDRRSGRLEWLHVHETWLNN
ncbi:MAG: hypothetical protein QNJ45_10215 [Ardenticatenaceae bacterium]|nr:hypothetical protein [Ardenticatenaceae bacterium]